MAFYYNHTRWIHWETWKILSKKLRTILRVCMTEKKRLAFNGISLKSCGMWSSIRFVTYLHASIGTMLKFQLVLLLHGNRNMVFNVIATHSNEISHENGYLLNAIDKMKYIQASIVKALRHIIFVLIQLVFCILIIARSCDSMIYWLMEMHYEQIDRSFARIPTMSMQINNQSQFHRRLISTDFFFGCKTSIFGA